MTLKKDKKEKKSKDNNDELMKDIKAVAIKHRILGFWVATPESCADFFADEATMYRFITTAHDVENEYTGIKEMNALNRRTNKKPISSKKKFDGDEYFG